MERSRTIDALKGACILLVILGHALQRSLPGYESNALFRVIYSFHMPLFMLLSGYVVGLRPGGGYGLPWLRKRSLSLLVPTIAWIPILYLAAKSDFSGLKPFVDTSMGLAHFWVRGIVYPATALWYLQVLFLCSCTFALALSIRRIPLWLSMFMLWFAIALAAPNYLGIAELKWYFAFFAIGVLLRRSSLVPPTMPWRIVAMLCFPLISLVALRMLPAVAPAMEPTRFSVVYYTAKFIWAMSGISFMWAVTFTASKRFRLVLLSRIGMVTLEIYTCAAIFGNLGVGAGYARVLTVGTSALALSLVVSAIVHKSPLLGGLFFGNSRNPYDSWATKPAAAMSGESATDTAA